MRMDYALMSLLELQSTSDQMDPALYAPIAAAAPASLAPEQAGNWAYPQPGMPPEEIAFCLVTGLAGRLYLSGHLNRMSDDELALVREGVEGVRGAARRTGPGGAVLAVGAADQSGRRRGAGTAGTRGHLPLPVVPAGGSKGEVALPLPTAVEGSTVETVYPRSLPAYELDWDTAERVLRVTPTVPGPTARVLRIG